MTKKDERREIIGCLAGFAGVIISILVLAVGIVGWAYSLFRPTSIAWPWAIIAGFICLVGFFLLALKNAPPMS